jgi:hypothetical protein
MNLDESEHALGGYLRLISASLDEKDVEKRKLKFTEEEEEKIEAKINLLMQEYQQAIRKTEEWLVEETFEPLQKTEYQRKIQFHQENIKQYVINIKKILLTYREKVKMERLQHARSSLLTQTSTNSQKQYVHYIITCDTIHSRKPTSFRFPVDNSLKSKSDGSAKDVTASLKRTKQVMSQEIERVSTVTKVLDDGRQALQSSKHEYSGVNAELAEVRRTLKVLQWQAQQDRMWIGAGITILVATICFIIYERTGFIFL